MPKVHTDETVREIVNFYNLGYGCRTVARLLEIPESTVEQILEGKIRRSVTGGRIMNGRRPKEMLRNDE